jgi:uncharacterized membrane protein
MVPRGFNTCLNMRRQALTHVQCSVKMPLQLIIALTLLVCTIFQNLKKNKSWPTRFFNFVARGSFSNGCSSWRLVMLDGITNFILFSQSSLWEWMRLGSRHHDLCCWPGWCPPFFAVLVVFLVLLPSVVCLITCRCHDASDVSHDWIGECQAMSTHWWACFLHQGPVCFKIPKSSAWSHKVSSFCGPPGIGMAGEALNWQGRLKYSASLFTFNRETSQQ